MDQKNYQFESKLASRIAQEVIKDDYQDSVTAQNFYQWSDLTRVVTTLLPIDTCLKASYISKSSFKHC